MTKLRPKELEAFARGQAAQSPDSSLSGSTAPAFGCLAPHMEAAGEPQPTRSARGRRQEAVSSPQAKSPRHGAGAGFSFLLRETLQRRKGRLRRGQGVGLQLVETHQFSGEASTAAYLSHWKRLGNALHGAPCTALDFSLALGGRAEGSGQGQSFPKTAPSTHSDLSLLALRLLCLARAVPCRSDHAHGLSPGHREASLPRAVSSGLQEGRHRSHCHHCCHEGGMH